MRAVEASLAQDLEDVSASMHVYEEYVVVDAAGRLQIPPEMCERTGIGSRVTLEEVEEGVLIRPVAGIKPILATNGQLAARSQSVGAETALLDDQPPTPRTRGLGRWLRRKRKQT